MSIGNSNFLSLYIYTAIAQIREGEEFNSILTCSKDRHFYLNISGKKYLYNVREQIRLSYTGCFKKNGKRGNARLIRISDILA